MQNIAWAYQVGHSTVHYIIHDVCKIPWDVLNEEYLKPPITVRKWEGIANDFWQLWNFPNCVGSLDGKHKYSSSPKNLDHYFTTTKSFCIVQNIILLSLTLVHTALRAMAVYLGNQHLAEH